MANDDSEWLERFLQTGVYEDPYLNSYTSHGQNSYSFRDVPEPYYHGQPAPIRHPSSNPPSRYASPYGMQPQAFVNPGDTIYHPAYPYQHPPPPHSQNYVPVPVPTSAPPQTYRAPPVAPPTQAPPVPMNTSSNPPNRDGTQASHDAKRRRLDSGQPVNSSAPKPPQTVPQAPVQAARPSVPAPTPARPQPPPSQVPRWSGKLANYSLAPRDPANRDFLKARADIVLPLNDNDAAEKIKYDPKTIARDVLVAAGRHPTEKTLNHHLFRLRDVFVSVDMHSDLDTFRWDLVDPRASSSNQNPKPAEAPRARDAIQPMAVVPPPSSTQARPPVQQQQQQITSTATKTTTNTATNTPTPFVQPPPLSKIHTPQQFHKTPVPTPKPSPRPVENHPSRPTPPQQPKSSVQQPAKPLPRVEVMVGKKQPTRGPSAKIEVKIQNPVSYQVYPCEWETCQAELHNLEMLKQHLLKVHIPYHISCKWKKCDYPEKMAAAELFQHINHDHLGPIAWKLGDGPSVQGTVGSETSSESPALLATPETNQPGGEDSLIFPASYSSIRAFNRVHGNVSQHSKAQEILKAVQRLKERIGVGLDPGGCQLATPARNQGVSNDEEFYEVIEA